MGLQKAVLKIGKQNKNAKEAAQYYDMPVQYNPASLSFSSGAGFIGEEGIGEEGRNARLSAALPSEITLSVELLFEAAENETAFLGDAKQRDMEESLGKKRTLRPEEKQKASESKRTVQTQVDGLLSLVMQVATRQVVFVWGDMSFAGELEDVNARYTMFDPKGNPVRARVELSIRQAAADSDDKVHSLESSYWKDAWKNFKKLAGKQKAEQALTKEYENAKELLKTGK